MRPPLFNGENYAYWKTMIRLSMQTNDYEAWRLIVNGPAIPTKKIEDKEIIKEEKEWDANDLKMAQLNAKAMHIFFFCIRS